MKEKFAFFSVGTFLYSVFYAFCLYKNIAGITFPFFVCGTFFFFGLCFKKLGMSIKKNSVFYMISAILLGISSCLTNDAKIYVPNMFFVFGLFLLFLIHQFQEDDQWNLGKYIAVIGEVMIGALSELGTPFKNCIQYAKENEKGSFIKIMYAVMGLAVSIPLILVICMLLISADAVFRSMATNLLEAINLGNVWGVFVTIVLVFLTVYCMFSYFLKGKIKNEVDDRRVLEPIIAITVNSVLAVIYIVFSLIQILYLFIGNMSLPEGYTYAGYAREGFFQLLAVCIINLILVVFCMAYFKESRILKGTLTIISVCTYIMTASSAMRMIIYIRYYYWTYLRIAVLWTLAAIVFLITGILIQIYKKEFKLFRYCLIVVTCFYISFAFARPDYMVAKCNVSNMESSEQGGFYLGMPYGDYGYLRKLSQDAVPAMYELFEENPEFLREYMDRHSTENTIRGFNFSKFYASRVYSNFSIDKE